MGAKRLIAKLMTPKSVGSPDFLLLIVTLVLLSLGIVMVLSASVGYLAGFTASLEKVDILKFGKLQLKWALIGLASMLFLAKIDIKVWKRLSPLLFLVGIIGLILVLPIFGGETTRGSNRWLNLGFITLQPSEGIKLALAMFVARALTEHGTKTWRDLKLAGGATFACVILVILQPDLGTTVVIAATALSMMFAAGISMRKLGPILIVGLIGAIVVVYFTGYMKDRVDLWLAGDGYQTVNALRALGSGGLFGVGLGQGMQKYGHIPENYTDMIFATIGEELGLLGTGTILFLFSLFVWRGFSIASRVKDPYARYLAVGITCMICFQTLINLGVVTGLGPVTGVTLPFISYGGSSLTIKLSTVGILLNISRYAKKDQTEKGFLQEAVPGKTTFLSK